MTEQEVMAEIAYVNQYFAQSFISFAVIEVKEYIHDPTIDATHSELSDDDITAALDPGHIVLAFAHPDAITQHICGLARRGGEMNLPVAIVEASCLDGTSRRHTTVHELGHVLGLPHTFQPFVTSPPKGQEHDPSQVPALNADCYLTGDLLCDTPSDPTDIYCSVKDCKASCDAPFVDYEPHPWLVMSYYDHVPSCQTAEAGFSQEQINLMRCVSLEALPEASKCQDCTPEKYTQCSGDGNLYYYDSCNKIGQLAQSCDDGNLCTEDSCASNNCQNTPVPDGMNCGGEKVCKVGSCVMEGEQQCESGACCSGGVFRPSSYVCADAVETEVGCPYGTDPGSDVAERTRDRYCSGLSSACDGSNGPWSGWTVADDCSPDEICVPGEAVCQAVSCSDMYLAQTYECPASTPADGPGPPGGGEIFEVCGDVDSNSGMVTITAVKFDDTMFGDRPYQVRVSGPDTADCGPDSNYFVVVDSDPAGIGTNTLEFSFQSNFLQGQTSKYYCVTASTKPGDPGHDDANALQKSWWWSGKINVTKECL